MSDFVSMPNPLAEKLAAYLRDQGYDVRFRIENGKPVWEGRHAGKVPLSAVESFYETFLDDEKSFWRLTTDGKVVRPEVRVFYEGYTTVGGEKLYSSTQANDLALRMGNKATTLDLTPAGQLH